MDKNELRGQVKMLCSDMPCPVDEIITLIRTAALDEVMNKNEEKLLDSKIEALIYDLCPFTSRAWIFDEGIPEKLRILIRNAVLDEAKEVVNIERDKYSNGYADKILGYIDAHIDNLKESSDEFD